MKYLSFCLLISVLFTSCSKQDLEPDFQPYDPVPTPILNTPSSIVIGDTSGMKIAIPLLTLDHNGDINNQINVPIWHQDPDDFTAIATYFDGPGPFNSYGLLFESSSSLEFIQDEGALISYEVDDTIESGSSPLTIIYRAGYSCQQSLSNGNIHSEDDQLLYFEYGDTISKSQHSTAYASVNRTSLYFPPSISNQNPDTTFVWENYYNKNCGNLANDTTTIIGFIMDVQGVEKLGWMKFEVGNGHSLTILEIAIQR
ncbi:MAG: hypothetical protein ACI857_002528 [Arenicella sp.]|jgi:hypothetical protein